MNASALGAVVESAAAISWAASCLASAEVKLKRTLLQPASDSRSIRDVSVRLNGRLHAVAVPVAVPGCRTAEQCHKCMNRSRNTRSAFRPNLVRSRPLPYCRPCARSSPRVRRRSQPIRRTRCNANAGWSSSVARSLLSPCRPPVDLVGGGHENISELARCITRERDPGIRLPVIFDGRDGDRGSREHGVCRLAIDASIVVLHTVCVDDDRMCAVTGR
jgi:hypothetical protein